MKKSTKEYISALKEYISFLKKNITFIKEKISVLQENKYFIPIITTIISLSIIMGINAVVESNIGTNKDEVSIATNTAEADFYNRKYDAAIEGYKEFQEKEEWPIWNVKIAEIYCVKGDFVKSNEILVNWKATFVIRNCKM